MRILDLSDFSPSIITYRTGDKMIYLETGSITSYLFVFPSSSTDTNSLVIG
jgi:hypothetical protein